MNYLITRHHGAQQWLKQQNIEPAILLEHLLHLNHIKPGDAIIGTLPVHLVTEVCQRGARYLHLEINIPENLRGQELSCQQLMQLNATLVEYSAKRINPNPLTNKKP